jgi:hypothetical protein
MRLTGDLWGVVEVVKGVPVGHGHPPSSFIHTQFLLMLQIFCHGPPTPLSFAPSTPTWLRPVHSVRFGLYNGPKPHSL